MSAFICNDSHITALAAYAARHRLCGYHEGHIEKIGAILQAENVRSVNYRYKDKEAEPAFTVCAWAEFRTFTPIQIVKAAHCLEYQSCEHRGWASSHANEIVQAIIAEAISELPGYGAADWEITRDKQGK